MPACPYPHFRAQIWILESEGGSLIGGAIKMFQEKRANPGPPRDPGLPPKPGGQTVGSFNRGLRVLTDAIGRNVQDKVRWVGSVVIWEWVMGGGGVS